MTLRINYYANLEEDADGVEYVSHKIKSEEIPNQNILEVTKLDAMMRGNEHIYPALWLKVFDGENIEILFRDIDGAMEKYSKKDRDSLYIKLEALRNSFYQQLEFNVFNARSINKNITTNTYFYFYTE